MGRGNGTRNTHDQACLLDIPGKLGILGQKTVSFRPVSISRSSSDHRRASLTRVDHLRAVVFGDFDDLVASQISPNRGVLASLANDVGFVGLCFPSVSLPSVFPKVPKFVKEGGSSGNESIVLCRCMLSRSS